MKRFICVLITVLLVMVCLPLWAGAVLTPQDKDLVMVTAIQASRSHLVSISITAITTGPSMTATNAHRTRTTVNRDNASVNC